ncbi:polymorphic toxin-type HINT domain-containing protein [Streptomyces sp. S063]|uniref:polymorphic toxin-type HINT domain-containing protein n=1 Tax=Streptomyces sp. S063 TaxID=2005885 RepID=UPI001F355C69|nr:polymorphic toxin-type HINT domain-containing protein [Streptomyces sp. S063]
MSLKDFIHLRLDIIGLFPGIGEPFDAANCIAYGVESGLNKFGIGDKDAWKDALLSCGSMLPIAGWAAAPMKGLRWSEKYGGAVGKVFESINNLFKRNPCSPKHSFPAGTPVLMADGTRLPIEQVRRGDVVYSTDPLSGDSGPRRVVATIYTPDDREFTGITLDGAQEAGELTATDNHPFWNVTAQSWTNAGQLRSGDYLRAPDGTPVKITQIRRWEELQPAYNLTVADLHTYYVLARSTPVLVHNSGGCGWATRHETAGDVAQKYTPGQSTRDPASQWYHEELSDQDLLDTINKAAEGDGIAVSRGGTILGGHHRWDELQKRIKSGRISPNTPIRIDVLGED